MPYARNPYELYRTLAFGNPCEEWLHNNRINTDWQFRSAPLPAGYAER